MIKKVLIFFLLVLSMTLNLLMLVENKKLEERLKIETIKRIDEKFQRNHPQNQKVIPKYPIIVQLSTIN